MRGRCGGQTGKGGGKRKQVEEVVKGERESERRGVCVCVCGKSGCGTGKESYVRSVDRMVSTCCGWSLLLSLAY